MKLDDDNLPLYVYLAFVFIFFAFGFALMSKEKEEKNNIMMECIKKYTPEECAKLRGAL